MADAITFQCSGCAMPYRVAASYAGREFDCKKCGTHLTVPAASQPRVEMGSGTEVMRRTTPSGRQVTVDPTRVFTRERETSQRMVAVGNSEGPKKSNTGLLIGGVLVGLVLVAGTVGAILFMGGQEREPEAPSGKTVKTEQAPQSEETPRDALLKRLDGNPDTADLIALLNEAEGELEQSDLTVIARALVNSISSGDDADLADDALVALAERMNRLKLGADTDRLYSLVIQRHRGSSEHPQAYLTARKMLGHALIDFDAEIQRADSLAATGVVDTADALRDELQTLKARSDEDWVPGDLKARVDEIARQLDAAQTEVDEIRRTDPFRFKLIEVRRKFTDEPASGIGQWVALGREPYVLLVQLQAGEDRQGAEERVAEAFEAADAYREFFNQELRETLGLRRMLPSDLPESERPGAPIVFKLFRDASRWHAHLREHGHGQVDATQARTFTEPATGHVSMVFEDGKASLDRFVRALVDVWAYNHHPNAPTTVEEDKDHLAYNAYLLNAYFHVALASYRLDDDLNYEFMARDSRVPDLLNRWRQPFARDARGRLVSLGGQVLTVRDFAGMKNREGLRQAVQDGIESLTGWTESDLLVARETRNLEHIAGGYLRGLYEFLYHWGDDGPRYRGKLLEFIRMDLAGEVDKDDPLPAFTKAFGLDDAGWQQLESDFTAYQTGK